MTKSRRLAYPALVHRENEKLRHDEELGSHY